MPPVKSGTGPASSVHGRGPRLHIFLIMPSILSTNPFSEMVAMGPRLRSTHASPRIPHVLEKMSALQSQSASRPNPSFETIEQAMFGCPVCVYATPPAECAHQQAAPCLASTTRHMLHGELDVDAPGAMDYAVGQYRHDPQHLRMCWLRSHRHLCHQLADGALTPYTQNRERIWIPH